MNFECFMLHICEHFSHHHSREFPFEHITHMRKKYCQNWSWMSAAREENLNETSIKYLKKKLSFNIKCSLVVKLLFLYTKLAALRLLIFHIEKNLSANELFFHSWRNSVVVFLNFPHRPINSMWKLLRGEKMRKNKRANTHLV